MQVGTGSAGLDAVLAVVLNLWLEESEFFCLLGIECWCFLPEV